MLTDTAPARQKWTLTSKTPREIDIYDPEPYPGPVPDPDPDPAPDPGPDLIVIQ